MLIHPSLIEKVSLDAREHNDEVAADIKRSFAYVGPVAVGSHEASPDAAVCNEIRLICRMSRPYWTDEGDGAQMWEAMRTWLGAKAYKVESTIANFNKSRGEAGRQTVDYDRVELDMKPYALGIACAQGDKLPDVVALAARMRELLGAGALPADMLGVEAPCAASLSQQMQAAAAQKAQAEAEKEQDQGGQASDQVAGEDAPVQEASAEAADQAGDAGRDGPAPQGDAPAADGAPESAAPERLPHASDDLAAVDYTLWDVRLADGTTRTFDSVAGTWA